MTADKKWDFVTHVVCGTVVEFNRIYEGGQPPITVEQAELSLPPLTVVCPKCNRPVALDELSSPGPFSATW